MRPPTARAPNVEALALKAGGKPVANPAREVWIQETALSTALNTSYMASQISLFGIVVGIALLLAGLGCGILAVGGALRNRDSALAHLQTHGSTTGASPRNCAIGLRTHDPVVEGAIV